MSEEPMLERVARAIFADYHRQGINHDDFDVLLPSIQDSLKSVARAAIEAMREPTEGMVDAAQWQIDPAALYANFIDAALEGK